MACNGLKWTLVDNDNFVNVIFGATFDKMIVDHELTLISAVFIREDGTTSCLYII